MAPPTDVNACGPVPPLARKRIGYARVSTDNECLDLQTDALNNAGCDRIFEDKPSSTRGRRRGLAAALSSLQRGDTLIVWRLDRLDRTTYQLISLIEKFERDGVSLRSIEDDIELSAATGEAMLRILQLLARMERNLIRERTEAGLLRGRPAGRNRRVPASLDTARRLLDTSMLSMDEIAARVGIPRSTLYRLMGPKIKKASE